MAFGTVFSKVSLDGADSRPRRPLGSPRCQLTRSRSVDLEKTEGAFDEWQVPGRTAPEKPQHLHRVLAAVS